MRVIIEKIDITFTTIEIVLKFINNSVNLDEFIRWIDKKQNALKFLCLGYNAHFERVDELDNKIKLIIDLPSSYLPFRSLVERLSRTLSLLEEIYIIENSFGVYIDIQPIVP